MKILFLLSRGALVMLGACLALGCSKLVSSSTQTLPATANASNTATATPVPSQNPEDKMPRVSAQEAKSQVDANQAVIIDVRGTEAYKTSHIKGAIDYPLTKLEGKDFSGLPKGKRIIAYCT